MFWHGWERLLSRSTDFESYALHWKLNNSLCDFGIESTERATPRTTLGRRETKTYTKLQLMHSIWCS